jgi:hypothetical protein
VTSGAYAVFSSHPNSSESQRGILLEVVETPARQAESSQLTIARTAENTGHYAHPSFNMKTWPLDAAA